MGHKLKIMQAFQAEFMAGDAETACKTHLSSEFRLLEPPELPHGGEFVGWDAPLRVANIYRAIWDVELLRTDFFDADDGDILTARYVMRWTHKTTRKSLTEAIVELNTIADGRIAQMEVFHFDCRGLLATMT
jgi:hypothetical protein